MPIYIYAMLLYGFGSWFSLVGGIGVIFGLYVVLWGKAKDIEELKGSTDQKLQKDQTRAVEILIDESSEKINGENDLEEPLLSDKSSKVDKISNMDQ